MVRQWALAGCIALGLGMPVRADGPQRVVSMNLCTDQLAMMLAAPGQLVSISFVSREPESSAMAREAEGYPVNHGQAEEIVRLKPDLVLAGSYSDQATVEMLRRFQIPVETFAPENDFDGIRKSIRKMGEVLGREAEAGAMIADFDRDLASLQDGPTDRPRAALYYPNGYTSGSDTLVGHIIDAAGFRNIATEAGLTEGGVLALEKLVLANPDQIIQGQRYSATSRSEEILDHPAVRELSKRAGGAAMADPDWVCGTPYVLNAIAKLRDARKALQGEGRS